MARPLTIHDAGRILRTQWWWVVAAVVVCTGTAVMATRYEHRSYSTSARLYVAASPPLGAANFDYSSLTQRIQSYVGIVDSPRVLSPVISNLGLPETETTLAKHLSASSAANTALIDVTANEPSAGEAAEVANAVSNQLATVIEQLETPRNSNNASVVVSVVRPATIPSAPSSPNTILNIALGAFIGIALGAAIAVWRARSDTTVRTAEDAAEDIALPTVGAIPSQGRSRKALTNGARVEAYRQLRTNLRLNQDHGRRGTVAVTSSVSGEGTTTTACNLAFAVAEIGLKVTLVEADLRNPSIASQLGLSDAQPGLVDLLGGSASLHDVHQSVPGQARLTVITAGTAHPNPTEILDSIQMRRCLEVLEEHNDVVIIDTPAVLPWADASIVSTMSKTVLLVVAAGRTPRETVARGLGRLQAVDANVSGIVLNLVPDAAAQLR